MKVVSYKHVNYRELSMSLIAVHIAVRTFKNFDLSGVLKCLIIITHSQKVRQDFGAN